MPRLHVVPWKEVIEPERLSDKVVIVIDVLFATTSIVAALSHGTTEVLATRNASEARRAACARPGESAILAGEKHLEPIDGFASPMPLALARQGLAGRRLIYSTTNGTVALRRAESAAFVYAAALVNAAAVVERVRSRHPRHDIIIVCAGSRGALSLEDFFAAGYLTERLIADAGTRWELSDAALAARHFHLGLTPEQCLLSSRIGRIVSAMDMVDEVLFAARIDALPLVAVHTGGGCLRTAW